MPGFLGRTKRCTGIFWAALLVAMAGCRLEPYDLFPDAGGGLDGGTPSDGGWDAGDGGGFHDAMQCIPPGQPEICNGLDDDCDGLVDEDFDLQYDPLNCGSCNNICNEPNADVVCNGGECVRTECWVGYKDLDPDEPGCEYRCPVFPEHPEECNGIDDDCDGLTDEPDSLVAPPTDLCRTTPGTPCEGVVPVCETRGNPPVTTWYCNYPATVEHNPDVPNGIVMDETLCDGQDGDCDGVADESFVELGRACDNGQVGACRDVGIVSCDPNDPTTTYCDLSVAPDPDPNAPRREECNGVDDDCDGVIDNPDPDDPARVVDDMVEIDRNGLHFWIYRYEASRPDATSSDSGAMTFRPCSNPDVLPWSAVTYDQAQAACQAVGKRLCTAAEWLAACQGPSESTYPYGNDYEPTACNGEDLDGISGGGDDDVLLPTGDPGMLSACVSEEGIYDLSGNLREWTDDQRGDTGDPDHVPIYVIRGGGYTTASPGMSCAFDLSHAVSTVVLPTVGFRCCSDQAP